MPTSFIKREMNNSVISWSRIVSSHNVHMLERCWSVHISVKSQCTHVRELLISTHQCAGFNKIFPNSLKYPNHWHRLIIFVNVELLIIWTSTLRPHINRFYGIMQSLLNSSNVQQPTTYLRWHIIEDGEESPVALLHGHSPKHVRPLHLVAPESPWELQRHLGYTIILLSLLVTRPNTSLHGVTHGNCSAI